MGSSVLGISNAFTTGEILRTDEHPDLMYQGVVVCSFTASVLICFSGIAKGAGKKPSRTPEYLLPLLPDCQQNVVGHFLFLGLGLRFKQAA